MSIRLDHPYAERTIVVVDDSAAGRLIVDGSGDHIEVIDVALLPEYRGHGIGTSVLRGVMAHADRLGRAIRAARREAEPGGSPLRAPGFR